MTAAKRVKKATGFDFEIGESVVYPTHGVGRMTAIEEQDVAGIRLRLFIVFFERDKMILRVPTEKAANVGLRKLSEPECVHQVLDVLASPSAGKRATWPRKAQEYEAKISSPDLSIIAEVVRDLYRPVGQPEPSYSERGLYEAALDLLVRELGAVKNITDTEALRLVEDHLAKSPRWTKDAEEDQGAIRDGRA